MSVVEQMAAQADHPQTPLFRNSCGGILKTGKDVHTQSAGFAPAHSVYKHPNGDAQVWWRAIAPSLKYLLECLSYAHAQQQETLSFTRDIVMPALGPYPNDIVDQAQNWKSFMTDDFTPIEFSWTWSDRIAGKRRLRFSIEPISHMAGTPLDPWNTFATLRLLTKLAESLSGLHLEWFKELHASLIPEHTSDSTIGHSADYPSRSSTFLAFEFGDSEPLVKAYLLPFSKAATTCQRDEVIVWDSLAQFAERHKWHHLQQVIDTVQTKGQPLLLRPFMVAIDCVVPDKSRFKVYLRSPDTSLGAVKSVLTMFDHSSMTEKGLGELRQLWMLLFGLDQDNFGDSAQLPHANHCTAGILYYIEVRPGSSKETVKVYLPVKHYAKNDQQAAEGLVTFLRTRQGYTNEIGDEFMRSLRHICGHRALSDSLGLQTYVSCAINETGNLEITSYLNPEIYHPNRYVTAT